MQQETQVKGKMTAKAMSAHMVSFYSAWVSKVLKTYNIEQLRRDIEKDPIVRDSMVYIGFLMVTTFGKYLVPILFTCHTVNHTQGFVPSCEKQPENREEKEEEDG